MVTVTQTIRHRVLIRHPWGSTFLSSRESTRTWHPCCSLGPQNLALCIKENISQQIEVPCWKNLPIRRSVLFSLIQNKTRHCQNVKLLFLANTFESWLNHMHNFLQDSQHLRIQGLISSFQPCPFHVGNTIPCRLADVYLFLFRVLTNSFSDGHGDLRGSFPIAQSDSSFLLYHGIARHM